MSTNETYKLTFKSLLMFNFVELLLNELRAETKRVRYTRAYIIFRLRHRWFIRKDERY